jgi:transposase
MLGDITQAKNVYIVCGHTDMRKGIRGLAALVQQNYQMDPTDSRLFLFCGKSRSQLKALLSEPDGFILLSKQSSNGRYQWPRTRSSFWTWPPAYAEVSSWRCSGMT